MTDREERSSRRRLMVEGAFIGALCAAVAGVISVFLSYFVFPSYVIAGVVLSVAARKAAPFGAILLGPIVTVIATVLFAGCVPFPGRGSAWGFGVVVALEYWYYHLIVGFLIAGILVWIVERRRVSGFSRSSLR